MLDLMTEGLTKVAIATRLSLVGTVADRADRRLISTWQRSTIAVLQLDTASFTGSACRGSAPDRMSQIGGRPLMGLISRLREGVYSFGEDRCRAEAAEK